MSKVTLIPASKTISSTGELFLKAYDLMEQWEIPFDPQWSNGTGYFDGATRQEVLKLAPGHFARSQAPGGRKIVMIGTHLGTVVIFQRYSDTPNVVVTNCDDLFRRSNMVPSGALDYDQLRLVVGYAMSNSLRGNIADVVKDIREALTRK